MYQKKKKIKKLNILTKHRFFPLSFMFRESPLYLVGTKRRYLLLMHCKNTIKDKKDTYETMYKLYHTIYVETHERKNELRFNFRK